MSYTVQSSEKLRKPGSEAETKALLYLMNFRSDSEEIYYFVIDFFNDLTGMDRMSNRLWDLQSKGNNNVSPKSIGRELITLFKNFMSEIDFYAYILFIGSVSVSVRKDSKLDIFDITNVTDSAIKAIKEGLIAEGKEKKYIDTGTLTNSNIECFLSKVLFVTDNGKSPSEYVKGIIKQHPNIIPSESVLQGIFNEIRDQQSSKKNVNIVEGITIETTDQALNYCRHLTNNEIRLLAIQRIIQCNPLEVGIPRSFIGIYNMWPPEHQKSKLDACQSAMCRALFNKNAADGFWGLFEKTYGLIMKYPKSDVQNIFNEIKKETEIVSRCPDFDVESLKYFIAIVKDGIQK